MLKYKFTQTSCQSLDNELLLAIGDKLDMFVRQDLNTSLANVYEAGPFALGGDRSNSSMASYILSLQKSLPRISSSIYVVALVLMQKFLQASSLNFLDLAYLDVPRLYFTAFLLAVKCNEDVLVEMHKLAKAH